VCVSCSHLRAERIQSESKKKDPCQALTIALAVTHAPAYALIPSVVHLKIIKYRLPRWTPGTHPIGVKWKKKGKKVLLQ
jgi:hypothetical protein